MRRLPVLILSALLLFGSARFAQAATYTVDPDHSTVSFKIRHVFSRVEGQFTKFSGTIDYDPDKPQTWGAAGTIDAASIDTHVEKRDKHLRSEAFFDVEKYPTITFKSTKVEEAAKDHAKLDGEITIHGVTKPITLDVEIHGVGKDPWGNVRAGFTATTKLNRKDFGLTWNQVLETGQLMVGDEVMVTIEAEGVLK